MSSIKRSFMKHGSTICTVSGVLLMLAGTVLAIKETSYALEHLKEEDIPEDAPKKEKVVRTVKATWKNYVLPTAFEVVGASLIFGGLNREIKNNQHLSGLLYASDIAYRNLQDKLDEKLTKKQVEEIKDELAEDKAKDNYTENVTIIHTDRGNHLFCDNVTGQFFRSSFEAVHHARETVRESANDNSYAKIGELLDLLGEHPCKIGERYWMSGSEIIQDWWETNFTLNGEEATAISYDMGHDPYQSEHA